MNGDGLPDVAVATDPEQQGVVQVYHGLPDGSLPQEPDLTIRPEPCYEDDILGVLTAADLNTDGFSDLIIGMPGRDRDRGLVMIYSGGSTGITTQPTQRLEPGPVPPTHVFGARVAVSTTITPDVLDLLVAAPQTGWGGMESGPGVVYRFEADTDGVDLTPAQDILIDAPTGFGFGWRLAAGGDLNADGRQDLVVGAWGDSLGYRLYVVRGGSGGFDPIEDVDAEAIPHPTRSGWWLGEIAAGDVDGDGLDELAVGDYEDDSVWLYQGGPGGLQSDPTRLVASDGVWADGEGPGDSWVGSYGSTLAMADLDGDGLQDLAVGATGSRALYDYSGQPGAVYLHFGSPRGLDLVSRTKVRPCGEAAPVDDAFGQFVRVVGDLDRDGTDDLVISGVAGPAILYGRAIWPAEACAAPWHPTPPTVACDDPVPDSPDTGTPVDTAPPDPVTGEAAPEARCGCDATPPGPTLALLRWLTRRSTR